MTDNLPAIPDNDLTEFNREPLDIERALALKLKGISYADISKIIGVPISTIRYNLQGLLPDNSNVDAFRKYRAEILAGKQEVVLKSLTEAKIKEMSGLQTATTFGILFDKERLELNKHTHNVVSYLDMSADAREAASNRRSLLDRLGLDEDTDVDTLEE